MNPILVTILMTLILSACANRSENTLPGQSSAFVGTLEGRWATGCDKQGELYYKKFLVFNATSGAFSSKSYKTACSGEPESFTGPTTFSYKIEARPGIGEGVLKLKVNDGREEKALVVLVDDVMTFSIFMKDTSRYLRVPQPTKNSNGDLR